MSYQWGEPDKKLIKNGVVTCPKCGKQPAKIDSQYGVLPCQDCQSKSLDIVKTGWSKSDLVKSRTYLPDGTVLTGMAGIRERDRRLRVQESAERYKKF